MEAYTRIYKIIVYKGPDISCSQNSVAIFALYEMQNQFFVY